MAVGQDIFARLRRFVEWQQGLEHLAGHGRLRWRRCGEPASRAVPGRDRSRDGHRQHAVVRHDGGRPGVSATCGASTPASRQKAQ